MVKKVWRFYTFLSSPIVGFGVSNVEVFLYNRPRAQQPQGRDKN